MKITLYQQIDETLRSHEDKHHAVTDSKYHKYLGHTSLGIRAPTFEKIMKTFRSAVRELHCNDAFTLTYELYKTKVEEYILAGNYVLRQNLDCLG